MCVFIVLRVLQFVTSVIEIDVLLDQVSKEHVDDKWLDKLENIHKMVKNG